MKTVPLIARRLRSQVMAVVEDRRRGVSTSREVTDHQLGFGDSRYHAYVATDYDTFKAAMGLVDIRPMQDVFVDFGSGKGRAVLLAAEMPFRRVIGVEYSMQLHADASRNLAALRHRRCGEVELVQADATRWPVPPDATVLFFFNPFDGEVLARVCENIRASLAESPRKITIVYVRADKFFEHEIAWTEWLTRIHEIPCSDGKVAIYENKAAG
ncbi:MAG: class I SAM-dependent methyltransferase [Rhizobiales bacterium]|nr:class I SAM-dependent methyltransferase [Hyphomicrobiales bacterium]MBI3674384.1 class I SAM-dependent methyltransferase [Hyphomicrobiales bacterium]